MIIKNTTQVGNPLIRTKAKNVSNLRTKKVQNIITNLTDSIHYHHLVGMAAPQIGIGLRIFVSQIRQTKLRNNKKLGKADPLRVYINPKIIWRSRKENTGWEGCGSVAAAGVFGQVKRPESVIVRAQDKEGKFFELKAHGLLARVIQHEYDHIEGMVFTDRADSKTYMSRSEYLTRIKGTE